MYNGLENYNKTGYEGLTQTWNYVQEVISESENLRQDLDDLLDNCDFSQHYQIFEEFWTQKRTEINEKNGNGLTPLQLASQMGHLQVNN